MMKSTLLILIILFFSSVCQAQDRVSDLNKILASIKQIEKEISSKQQTLNSPQATGKEVELNNQISDLAAQQKSLEHSLEEIASGVNIELFAESKIGQKISWENELQELMGPVLSQIKRATSRPREIEKLRTDLGDTEELITVSDTAINNLIELKNASKNLIEVNTAISSLEENWDKRRKSLEAKSSILRQKLQQRTGEKKNLSQSLEEIFQLFFKSRGRNLLIALLFSVVFWICFKKIHKNIQVKAYSKEKSFNSRLFNMLFLLGSGVGAICVFLIVLFFSGDWLLLLLSFFLLTGVIWNSKDAISKFWGESLLLLNLGPVREGERVIYNGVPMHVSALNYHALLDNPLFTSAPIKLPIRDLLTLRSRTSEKDEVWFPTKQGDWVLLGGIKLANVEVQTIENVILRFPGGAHCTVSSSKFLLSEPINISSGFRTSISIGFDNALLDKIDETLKILDQQVRNKIAKTQYHQHLSQLKVEFEKPGTSTLDIAIIADFKGEIAKDYDSIRRLLNRMAVEICNENKWHLPNPQVDIHLRTGNL